MNDPFSLATLRQNTRTSQAVALPMQIQSGSGYHFGGVTTLPQPWNGNQRFDGGIDLGGDGETVATTGIIVAHPIIGFPIGGEPGVGPTRIGVQPIAAQPPSDNAPVTTEPIMTTTPPAQTPGPTNPPRGYRPNPIQKVDPVTGAPVQITPTPPTVAQTTPSDSSLPTMYPGSGSVAGGVAYPDVTQGTTPLASTSSTTSGPPTLLILAFVGLLIGVGIWWYMKHHKKEAASK